jgi:hypothetical protein
LFIDYEKAVDSIQREIMSDILKSRNISGTLLKTIADMYTQKNINTIQLQTKKLAEIV